MTRDILDEPGPARFAESYPSVGAAIGLAVLHRSTGLRGRIDKFTGDIVQIRDPAGREHRFRNRPGAFAVAGETVTLVRPAPPPTTATGTLRRTAAGALVSVEHTARTGADKGYIMVIPEDACSTMNADWHRASIEYAMQNVAVVTKTDHVIRALGG